MVATCRNLGKWVGEVSGWSGIELVDLSYLEAGLGGLSEENEVWQKVRVTFLSTKAGSIGLISCCVVVFVRREGFGMRCGEKQVREDVGGA